MLVDYKYVFRIFEDICIFFDQHSTFIPLTFMLGFYVTAVFNRWWLVFGNIGWIDQPSLQITMSIRGTDERSKILRRTCIRYLVLMEALVFRDISTSVRIRFPTPRHLVTSGLMTEREFEEYEAVVTPHAKYWLPIQWLLSLVTLARDESRIKGEHIYVSLCEQIAAYRVKLVRLVLFDWVPVPLVYTQVVHLAVYSYFLVALFGRQYLDRDAVKKSVAEVLLNPLGEDDDDFECNWIIDRNLQVGFSVEECYNQYPPVDRDSFWTDSNPEPLYTAMSAMRPTNPQVGSCVNM
uniref:Bestrophin homolog n=1 Tax=Angiostrongylus cantonensis TaxID=6313 RepID=A0A0K0DPR5_ANGCA